MAIYIKYKKQIDEDDTSPENIGQQDSTEQENDSQVDDAISKLESDIVTLKEKKRTVQTDYENKVKNIEQQKNQLQEKLAQLDGADKDPQKKKESVSIKTDIIKKKNQKRVAQTEFENQTRTVDEQILQIEMKIAELDGDIDVNESLKRRIGRKLYEALLNKTDEMFDLVSFVFDEMMSEDRISFVPNETRCMRFAKNIIAYINRGEFTPETVKDDLFDFLMNLLGNSQISFSNREKEMFAEKLIDEMSENVLFSWIFENKNEN